MIAQDGHNLHLLKTDQREFINTLERRKSVEHRKDDRFYQAGDFLVLREYYPDTKKYSNRNLLAVITCIEKDKHGIAEGYCNLSIRTLEVDRDI